MADDQEKYFWLLWTIAASSLSYYFFSITVTLSILLAGIFISCKCLIEDFPHTNEENHNERNH